MDRFINRTEELAFLEDEYKRNGSSLVVLYGRRRVGKTALAAHFIRGKQAVYFLASEENEFQNRNTFKSIIAEHISSDLLKDAQISNWDVIFKAWIDNPAEKKKLMVIDEFQYLGKANSAFPSIFQRVWDTMLKDNNVMVILCGSLVSIMESQTLSYTSPLYGRRTGQIKLKQMPFCHYNDFFPEKNEKELIEFYAITGGVPKYIELLYENRNIYEAIEKNILSKNGFFYDEPNFLLRREVSDIGSYLSIIKTIAAGNKKLSKIAASLEIKQTGLTNYLKTLIDLDILERETPVTEDNPEKSKKGLYKIKDNLMAFWFKFVFPNLHYLESGDTDPVMRKIKANLTDSHIAFIYEDICTQRMRQLNIDNVWDFDFDKAGRWWNNNTEIDIVALNTGGDEIIFGECKYRNRKTGIDVLNELKRKVLQVEWKRDTRREHYVIFCPGGFTDELSELAETRNDLKLISEVM